jgi:signal peptidase I
VDAVVRRAAAPPRPLAATVALVALAVGVAVGLTDRQNLGNSDSTTRAGDKATETTPRPSAAEGSALAAAAVAEETIAEPQAPPKPRRRFRDLLGWAVYLGVIVGAIVLGPTALGWALGSEYPMAAISSGSMWPALKEGDVVLLKGVDSIEDVKVGDIIAFRHREGFAIHRIASIEGAQITTKGDANTREDQPIEIEDVIGKVPTIAGTTARIPYLGNISFLLGPLLNQTDDLAGSGGDAAADSGAELRSEEESP